MNRLIIDRSVADSPVVRLIRSRLDLPVEIVDGPASVYAALDSETDSLLAGKQILFLTRNRGRFIRVCPGTRHYTCCGYRILHIATYCTMDCSYCILQAYFHPPVLQYFVNHEDLFTALDEVFTSVKVTRIGTGEFTDSMIWEPWTDLTPALVCRFGEQQRAVLELKTKTLQITALKGLCHHRKTVMAWSVNTPRIIESEERNTSGLTQRLDAAAQCQAWGYPLAFHFDPMVIYPGCRAEYQAVVDRIFSAVSPGNVVWISLGTFRFAPALKPIIQTRFPNSTLPYGEFIPGLDGKMRYFKPLRIDLYRSVVERIRVYAPQTTVYLCMEDAEVWSRALGVTPSERGGLPGMLDRAAEKICGVKSG